MTKILLLLVIPMLLLLLPLPSALGEQPAGQQNLVEEAKKLGVSQELIDKAENDPNAQQDLDEAVKAMGGAGTGGDPGSSWAGWLKQNLGGSLSGSNAPSPQGEADGSFPDLGNLDISPSEAQAPEGPTTEAPQSEEKAPSPSPLLTLSLSSSPSLSPSPVLSPLATPPTSAPTA